MAKELQAETTTGLTIYAVLISATGTFWNTAGTPAFETYNGANWTDYDIALTEAGAGVYLGDMPAAAAGVYSYAVYSQAGASPATTDALKGTGWLAWDGSAEIIPSDFDPATDTVATVTTVNGLATDAITAASLKTDAVNEIQNGVIVYGYGSPTIQAYLKIFTMPADQTGLTTVTPGSTGWARYAGCILFVNAVGAYRIVSADDTTLTLDRALLFGGLACAIIPDSIATLSTLTAAQVNTEVVDAISIDVVADSIPADGSRGSLTQYAYMILQFLMERSVSSTTMEVYKPDGTTALMTFTLNDADTPSAITRAS